MNNFKINCVMIGHEEPKTFDVKEKDENGKPKKDGKKIGEMTVISTLFVRTVDSDLGEKMNPDKTYPFCDVFVVRLSPEIFRKFKAFEPVTFICDSYAADKYQERITPKKVKIGGEIISLKADDVDTSKTSTLEAL